MTEFNFADDGQMNAFCRELGLALRRIARQDQDQPDIAIELPTPTEKTVSIRAFVLEDVSGD